MWLSFCHRLVSWRIWKIINLVRKKHWKYITFTIRIEKEVTRIDKNGEEITKNISYVLQIVDSARFMTKSLWNLVKNLSEGIHKIKCKYGHDDKKYKTSKIKYCDCFLAYTNFEDNVIEYKCLYCNKNYEQHFHEKLKKQFLNTYKLLNHNKNKFILLLRKGVYPYEYLDDWEKFSETSLLEK